jgi:hypothetical protein
MNKIGVNDDCPCGSGKKYKKCYKLSSEGCSVYVKEKHIKMSEEYEKICKEVTDSLLKTTTDLNQLFYKTPEDAEVVPPLMQLIGIFTVIDVLASYWYEYLGKSGTQSERFDEYVNTFCFTEKNQEFVGRKYLKDCTTEEIRGLRNSIVHFYGLGTNNRFCIIPNLSKLSPQNQIDQIAANFSKLRKDIVFIFIQPFELKKIVIEGAVVMLQKFQIDAGSSYSEQDKVSRIEAVERINKKLKAEGAVAVSKEMADKMNYALQNK